MNLVVPLQFKQVEAANRIYGQAAQWQRIDRALQLLRDRVPGFSEEETLLKAATVNALYGTNVYLIPHVAQHVSGVLASRDPSSAGPDLVEEMATVRLPNDRQCRFHSFASKFAHFFIEPERFPILDKYAESMVRYHMGIIKASADAGRRYLDFVAGIECLEAGLEPKVGKAALDRYLLIAGQYRAYCNGRVKEIGSELRGLFEPGREDLRILTGDGS